MNEKKALIKWLNGYEWNVFGTLNFKYQINEIAAENALKYFWNKVDRYYFGNKSHRNNIKVKRMCFLQKGYSNQNSHFHFVAITPNNETDINFIKTLKRIWQYEVKESGYFSEFETIEIKEAVTNYLTHEYYKLGSDTLNTTTAHLN